MLVITLQRKKCIGCNYCVEVAPDLFRISTKDGKSVLLKSYEKKGFHTLKTPNMHLSEQAEKAKEVCPVKIIHVKHL